MLAKSRKLNLSLPETRRLVRTFVRLSSSHLVIKYQKMSSAAGMVVVSKQVDARAVVRNKIKRALYKYLQTTFTQGSRLQVIVWVMRPAPKKTFLAELSELIAKIAVK